MTGAPREEGFGLVEVAVALAVLAVGLLGAAALVRAVSHQSSQARAAADAALAAQQVLEAALAGDVASSALSDTMGFAGRDYVLTMRSDSVGPALERIGVEVAEAGSPGYGARHLPARSYVTLWRRRLPLPVLPPALP
ncbi:MAG: prepilin-type N-terminal cleavage/methylation domain-containing protein [Gemmatimonadota bacterium]|nr:MAG: prepilin-type N-terminal cleavage/methylation domain-containing protein [Gemmatimonadota bacterium]